MTLQNDNFFLICCQLMRHPLIELFHLSNLFQMPNNRGIVGVELLGNFLCSSRRIRLDDALSWSLSTSDGQLWCSSSSGISFPLQNFLNHHCTVCLVAVLGPSNACWCRVLSLLLCDSFWTGIKKCLNLLLSNIISIV